MKKEKLKKVDTNEKNEIEDSKFRKKFKLLKGWMIFFEGILLVPVIVTILFMVIIAGEVLVSGTNEFAKSIIIDETSEEVEEEIKIDDIVKLAEELSGEDLMVEDETNEFKRFVAISQIIIVFLDYICLVIIVDTLGRIFGNVEKEGTPFTKENVKKLSVINLFAVILFIFGTPNISIGLISIIIISAITYIFKYGYKIQQEIDETL